MLNLETYKNMMIKDGCSEKYANYFMAQIQEERAHSQYDREYGEWALSKGFLFFHAKLFKLNQDNYNNYISDYNYYKLYPINSWSRIWVDDKLTLKLMLQETPYAYLMPRYYFYSTDKGLKELADNPRQGHQGYNDLLMVLQEVKDMACKPNNGTGGGGFFKLSYKNGCIYKNNHLISIEELFMLLEKSPNYIFTEFIYPREDFAKIHPVIPTIRVVTVNEKGNNPFLAHSVIRFGTNEDSVINICNETENDTTKYNYNARIDIETGHMSQACKVYFDHCIFEPKHPISGVKIERDLDCWTQIRQVSIDLAKRFFNCELLGFDFGISDQGLKLMEINTLPGIRMGQFYGDIGPDTPFYNWMMNKIEESR